MAALSNLIKLTRPNNLIIVALTMFVVRICVILPISNRQPIISELGVSWFQFFLITLIPILLTASGNIINDYFDQKVDRINKPLKVIVGKTVKRRIAMVLHQGLNILALFLTLIICYSTSLWWPIFIPVVIATSLWWYSPLLKKKIVLGNLTVALCTAAVPLWGGLFDLVLLEQNYKDQLPNSESHFNFYWLVILSLSLFAFVLTLVREAQKDIEDLDGDIQGGYSTIPIKYGITTTKKYIYVLLGIYMAFVLITLYLLSSYFISNKILLFSIGTLTLLLAATSIKKTKSAHTKQDFHNVSHWTKITMIIGLISFVILGCFL